MTNRTRSLSLALGCLSVSLAACDTVPRDLQRDKAPDPAASGQLAACVNCHGEGSNPAPPRSVSGSTSTADIGVGAHAAHLTDSPLRPAIACSECHLPVTDLTHMDGLVRVAFGPLASAGGATPAWSRAGPAPSCATTYCHGATLAGGTNVTPVWTRVDGSQASCGTCHGLPPPPPHTTSTSCGACHPGYTATTVVAATHIDGVLQLATGDGGTLACGSCHSIPPPPPHPASTSCGTCHSGYTSTTVNATLHQNGTVDVLALSCTSCHGAPPSTGQHTRSDHVRRSCGDCHPGYSATSANAALHQNGAADVGNRITSYDRSTRNCANSCHGDERW
ncbi:MAG TPA: CxxxxCH/CxxCH domain-containing protein [Anaeromyxobacteraceae bacterium]|nr:CxxxxCH/CxxCH domain-containing protein [Anaeromyxobacteraceae bacterium]